MRHQISEYDCFFLSYDEPQKEEFWAKLQDICPWAQRIDGVKGFDNAHKACANASTTDRFITVDGDNIVYPEFFDLEINIPDKLNDKVLSWGARNIVNGLVYGNGGVKLWTKEFVLNMRTHENATRDEEKIDFCWDDKYVQLNNTYSDTCPNGSPFQAFRAGFREGVKMTLDRGVKLDGGKIQNKLYAKNYKRLLIWASVGADVENGLWSIYGTRLGIHAANIDKSFDISKISDYDWFKSHFETEVFPKGSSAEFLAREIKELDRILYQNLGMEVALLDEAQSRFFKAVYESPQRTHDPVTTEVEADRM